MNKKLKTELLLQIRPSAADRWMVCPGSVLLCKDLPDTTSEFAEEGTRAHTLAEQALKAGVEPVEVDGADPDMAHFVGKYTDYVRSLL